MKTLQEFHDKIVACHNSMAELGRYLVRKGLEAPGRAKQTVFGVELDLNDPWDQLPPEGHTAATLVFGQRLLRGEDVEGALKKELAVYIAAHGE